MDVAWMLHGCCMGVAWMLHVAAQFCCGGRPTMRPLSPAVASLGGSDEDQSDEKNNLIQTTLSSARTLGGTLITDLIHSL